MPLIGRPYSLILLEVEEAITHRGENRPLIVEAAYRKVIKEYGDSLTEDDKICLGAFRIIMEELALKNTLQIDAGRLIQSKNAVQRWGIHKIPGWAGMKPEVQLARLLGGLSDDAKAQVPEICAADGKPIGDGDFKFDLEDPKGTTEKIAKVFLEDILKQNAELP